MISFRLLLAGYDKDGRFVGSFESQNISIRQDGGWVFIDRTGVYKSSSAIASEERSALIFRLSQPVDMPASNDRQTSDDRKKFVEAIHGRLTDETCRVHYFVTQNVLPPIPDYLD